MSSLAELVSSSLITSHEEPQIFAGRYATPALLPPVPCVQPGPVRETRSRKVDPPGQVSGNQSRCIERSKITSGTLGNNTNINGSYSRKAMARMSHHSTGCPSTQRQAALFAPLTLAHLARCATAIFRRAEADIVRFLGISAMPFAFAQRAFWAAATRARPLADIFRRGLTPLVFR